MEENESKSRAELLQELAVYREKSHRLDNLHHLLDNMSAGVEIAEIILDPNGSAHDFHILEINETLGRLLNIDPKVVCGSTVLQLLPQADPSWMKILADVVIQKRPPQFERYSPFFWQMVQGAGLLSRSWSVELPPHGYHRSQAG